MIALHLLLLIVIALIPACATRYAIFTDRKTDADFVRMIGNRLSGGIANVELNAQKQKLKGRTSYSLILIYTGPAPVQIIQGNSLILILDGERLVMNGAGSEKYRETVLPGILEEKAFYHDIDPELICRLSEAKVVEIEVMGINKTLKRAFNRNNISNFKDFCYNYVQKP